MVGEEHFGGFLTRKTETKGDGKVKSWKERMEEIIVQSKKLKVRKQTSISQERLFTQITLQYILHK